MGDVGRVSRATVTMAWMALASVIGATHIATPAVATSCLTCDARLVHADCSPGRYGEILPVGVAPMLAAECEETSCAPPIPPDYQHTCGVLHRTVNPDHFLIRDRSVRRVEGAFEALGRCGDAILLGFSESLPVGRFVVSTRVSGCVAHGDEVVVGPAEATFLVTDSTIPGDCDGDGSVGVDELILGIALALGIQPMELCRLLDADDNELADVSEVLRAVAAALEDPR
jgi:hypothetical protein